MTPTSRILAARLGALAGRGAFGARLVARWLPDNVGKADFTVAQSPDDVRAQAKALVQQRGELLDPSEFPADQDTVAAVVGAGKMSLNPTVVTIRVSSSSAAGTSAVEVMAVAKEGLIRQRAGEEVAAWIQEALGGRGAK